MVNKKTLTLSILLIFILTALTIAKPVKVTVNKLDYIYWDEDNMWELYYPQSTTTLRNYVSYNYFIYGYTDETLQPVNTQATPIGDTDAMGRPVDNTPEFTTDSSAPGGDVTYQTHMVTLHDNSKATNEWAVTNYGGTEHAPAGFVMSNETDAGGNYVYYQQFTGEGNPNNKWPYNKPIYAYRRSSFEYYNVQSNTDAFVQDTAEGVPVYVSDPATVEANGLVDYVLEYNGTGYDVYPVTEWVEDTADEVPGEWKAELGSSIATISPDADQTFEGITLHVTDGNTTAPQTGDQFLIRALGLVSDLDTIVVTKDVSNLAPEAGMENPDLFVVHRTYMFDETYLNKTIIHDFEIANPADNRDLNNFHVGSFLYGNIGGYIWDDAVQYYPAEKLSVMYDAAGGTADGAADWDTGSYGSKPYDLYVVKMMKDFYVEERPLDPYKRFTFMGGVAANNAVYGATSMNDAYYKMGWNGATQKTTVPVDEAAGYFWACLEAPNPGGTTPPYGGVMLNAYDSDPAYGNNTKTWWNTSVYTANLWDCMTGGSKSWVNDVWATYNLSDLQTFWPGEPFTAGNHHAWVIDTLAAGETVRFVFAESMVDRDSWDYENGQFFSNLDNEYADVMTLNDNLDELWENYMSTDVTPLVPTITKKLNYSEAEDRFENNESIQVEFAFNSELAPYGDIYGPSYATTAYKLEMFDGEKQKDIIKFRAFLNNAEITGTGVSLQDMLDADADILTNPANPNYDSKGSYFQLSEHDETEGEEVEDMNPNRWYLIAPASVSLDGISANDLNFEIGIRFAEGTTDYTDIDNIVGYIFEMEDLRFAYPYEFTLSAIDGRDVESSTTFELAPAAMAHRSGIGDVTVVPNPLYVSTYLDNVQEKSEIKFNRLPNKCKIRIFDISGKILRTLTKNNTETHMSWDLLTKYNQEVAPGMYIFVVTDDNGNKQKGTFSI